MYRIGEFSYLFGVTIKTLRHYDKIGLFQPERVDTFTGYRYYSDKQKEEFSNILKLKNLNFTLEEIKKLKNNFTEEVIKEKIKSLELEKEIINEKQEELKKLSKGEVKMKYDIGFVSNMDFGMVGISVVVEKREKEVLEKYFNIVKEKINKLGINSEQRVIITLEVGYKEKDLELFIGYLLEHNLSYRKRIKLHKKKEKLGLECFGYPNFDYIGALDVEEEKDIKEVCSNLIDYASLNKLQIIGPFIEIYENDHASIFVPINDLKRPEVYIMRRNKKLKEKYKEFVDNKEIIGSWKIKEILPNIDFNPNRQKSIPDTKYDVLMFYENGKTNFENVFWNNNSLLIKKDDILIDCKIEKHVINKKEYLEIRMHDMYSVYENAKPISYIYEKGE